MNILLTRSFIPKFFVSRQKTLLKRRKIAVKKRPISQKKLKQQAKHMNYSLQYKALQIQKQLDRRANPNRHINQLMQQIFYPDIAYTNQQTLNKTLQLSKESPEFLHEQESTHTNNQTNQIMQKIKQFVLPQDILSFHQQLKNHSKIMAQQQNNYDYLLLLDHQYYQTLFGQLCNYFIKRDSIKDKILKDWEYKMNKMQKRQKSFKKSKCPYNFYDSEDIYLCMPWKEVVSDFAKFVQESEFNLEDQEKIQRDIINMFTEIDIALDISQSINTLPAEIYNKITGKILKFSQLSSDQNILSYLTLEQKTKIMNFINLSKILKHPEHTIIQLSQTTQQQQKTKKLKQLCNYVCINIIKDPHCTSSHLSTVVSTQQNKVINFTKQFSQLSKMVVIKQMSQLPYQKIVDYFVMYLLQSSVYDKQFIQLMKFDIYRKSGSAVSKEHLIRCLEMVEIGKLIKNQKVKDVNQIQGRQLFIKTAQSLSAKFCGKGMLSEMQITKIINLFLKNNIKNRNLLQLMANELVRNKQTITLQNLSQSAFTLNILGYKSPILSQVIFNQFTQRYKKTYKKYIQDKKYLLPEQQQSKQQQQLATKKTKQYISLQTIRLEQTLILSIWMLVSSIKQYNQYLMQRNNNRIDEKKMIKISTDKLLKIYPLKIQSNSLLIQQLCKNIYQIVKQYAMFWPIIPKNVQNQQNSSDRLKKYYTQLVFINDFTEKTMKMQAIQSLKFIYNYNKEEKKYIKQPWSSFNTYEYENYSDWVWACRDQKKQINYFNREKQVSINVYENRKKIIESINKQLNEDKQTTNQERKNKQKIDIKEQYQYYKLD